MMEVMDKRTVAYEIVDLMGQGLSLRKATKQVGTTVQSFLRWCDADKALADHYARARQGLIDKMADEILELADAPVPTLDNGATDNGLVRQRQLQVDTRKWFLSKLAPKVYGDRLDVSVTDTRISIQGALQAAQSRLADVIDVTPRITSTNADHADDASEDGGVGP